MSRIGKLPINLPKGVSVNVSNNNIVTVKGPLGELSEQVNPAITVNVDDSKIEVSRSSDAPGEVGGAHERLAAGGHFPRDIVVQHGPAARPVRGLRAGQDST